jgi:DNA-binding HxlR family transcriptional regulator
MQACRQPASTGPCLTCRVIPRRRDIGLFDKHRNKDFQEADEGIPSNILASRLKHLVEQGLLEKRLYQERPPGYEYHLTQAGEDFLPIVKAMAKWGAENFDPVQIPTFKDNNSIMRSD